MGWKGVREPLYIYGLCRTGGSGVVKRSHAPKPSLNIKYITDSGIGDGTKQNRRRLRSETDHRGQCDIVMNTMVMHRGLQQRKKESPSSTTV